MTGFLLGFALGAIVGSPLLWFIVCRGIVDGWWVRIASIVRRGR